MPVNPDFAGRTYPPSGPYAVEADSIAAFAAAVGSADPVHTDAEWASESEFGERMERFIAEIPEGLGKRRAKRRCWTVRCIRGVGRPPYRLQIPIVINPRTMPA